MSSIFSSKFYKNSTRQDKINSNLKNPFNKGLVQQIADQLNDEELLKYVNQDEVDTPTDEELDNIEPDESIDNTEDLKDEHSTSENSILDEDAPITESNSLIKKDNQKVTASEDTHNLDYDVLIGSLNNIEETKGIRSITLKDEELWLYYKDNINLNNIMDAVVNRVYTFGYTNLEFNRLARTQNAIVFTYIEGTTFAGSVEPTSFDE